MTAAPPASTPPDLGTELDAAATFWRSQPQFWFRKSDDFDTRFRERFLAAHEQALATDWANGAFQTWCLSQGEAAAGRALGVLVLLDQFPRNAFRGDPRMFAADPMARQVARLALAAQLDEHIDTELRKFFYLPFMHSESINDQELCVALHATAELPMEHAIEHRDIIQTYGRFPHRNAVLGRTSSPAELKFLAEGGFAG